MKLILRYEDEEGRIKHEQFDLVVLSSGIVPKKDMSELADCIGINLNGWGFCDKVLDTIYLSGQIKQVFM